MKTMNKNLAATFVALLMLFGASAQAGVVENMSDFGVFSIDITDGLDESFSYSNTLYSEGLMKKGVMEFDVMFAGDRLYYEEGSGSALMKRAELVSKFSVCGTFLRCKKEDKLYWDVLPLFGMGYSKNVADGTSAFYDFGIEFAIAADGRKAESTEWIKAYEVTLAWKDRSLVSGNTDSQGASVFKGEASSLFSVKGQRLVLAGKYNRLTPDASEIEPVSSYKAGGGFDPMCFLGESCTSVGQFFVMLGVKDENLTPNKIFKKVGDEFYVEFAYSLYLP